MNEKIRIVPYEGTFQEEIVDLIVHIQQKEYNVPITKEEQPDLLEIETFYQKDHGNFWVAIYDGKVVGTVALLDIENHQVALRKMFVKKEFRGKEWGASHMLLQKQFHGLRIKIERYLLRNNSKIFSGTSFL